MVNTDREDVLFIVADPLDTGHPFYVEIVHMGEIEPFFRWWVILLFVILVICFAIAAGMVLTYVGIK